MKKLAIAFITALAIFVSCKKDSKDKPNTSSRTLRYDITGNFTGTFFVAYTTAAGGTTNDQVTLPWTKEITFSNNVTSATVALIGNGGVAGQKVTLIIKRGGTQVGAPIEAVAESSGSFSKSAPVTVF